MRALAPFSGSFKWRLAPSIWIYAILAMTLLAICALVGSVLLTARVNEQKRAETEASNIVAAITQDISRNIELYDLSIRGALEGVALPSVMNAPKDLRQLILFDRAATAPYLGRILILDSKGDIIADSTSTTIQPLNYSDRDYFRIQAQRPDFGLYISRPLKSRSDGQWIIGLSRRINNPDGSFGGVVVGTLRLEYFHSLFSQIKLGPGGSLTLFRNDGTMLMREPFDPALIGVLQRPPLLFDAAARAAEGQFEGVSAVDGIERLYSFRRIGRFPLIQTVGLSIQDIFSQWLRRAILLGSVMLFCCGLITGLTVVLTRELRRRTQAEAKLLAMVEKDALTGLFNRRCLDRVLDNEWRQATRLGTSLSVLMIDADQFKIYNDTLGHAAGDEALRRLAGCMIAVARRGGDLPARYGGEEFVMILPHTDSAGAAILAERLRQSVEALAIPHPRSTAGSLTVSIGVATMIPNGTKGAGELLSIADKALYRSKRNGRNRTTVWCDQAAPLRIAS